MKSLAHLNALRAFEASARHQSFSAAAAELHVTPAAVGQLVRTLEAWLGVPLFLRHHTGHTRLIPTETAQKALPEIRTGLAHLAIGLSALQAHSSLQMLTVTVSPAFAAKWLLPRIDRFHALYPDIKLRLDTSLQGIDFVAQGIDIGVRYGQGNWLGLTAEKWMDEEVYPVCSPNFLAKSQHITKPIDLKNQILIDDLSLNGHTGFPTWADWLQKAGVNPLGLKCSMQINNSAAVLQAAIDGLGVALARSVMAADDLANHRLVRLFPMIQYGSKLAYYVVYRPECAHLPPIKAFREWLMHTTHTKENAPSSGALEK